MTERALILLAISGVAGLFLVVFTWYRRRDVGGPERLDLADFGLELMAGCCAFVVFTTPSCAPCKPIVRRIGLLVEEGGGMTELVVINALDHAEVAVRYGVRSVPTVFLITASGHVVERWNRAPENEELSVALNAPLSAQGPPSRTPRVRS